MHVSRVVVVVAANQSLAMPRPAHKWNCVVLIETPFYVAQDSD